MSIEDRRLTDAQKEEFLRILKELPRILTKVRIVGFANPRLTNNIRKTKKMLLSSQYNQDSGKFTGKGFIIDIKDLQWNPLARNRKFCARLKNVCGVTLNRGHY